MLYHKLHWGHREGGRIFIGGPPPFEPPLFRIPENAVTRNLFLGGGDFLPSLSSLSFLSFLRHFFFSPIPSNGAKKFGKHC